MNEKIEKFDRRGKSKNINKLRNLPQYRGKSDEELQALLEEKESSPEAMIRNLEEEIEKKMQLFSEDYDLTDLKINDREVLRGLIQSIIALEHYEQKLYVLRMEINPDNIIVIDKLQKIMSDLRADISKAQDDLSIKRKIRKSDQETSVIAYIESLKEKARKFYQSRMSYVFCPKCHTLLFTGWFLFPESINVVTLECQQKDKNDKPCGTKVKVTSNELLESRNTNNREVIPDSLI